MTARLTKRIGAISALVVSAGAAPTLAGETVFGVTENQTLITWDTAAPTSILSGVAISGLASNEQIRGIDFRPATGQMFALGSFNNLYTIDTGTGAASLVGSGGFTPGLNGSSFGFDFNPVIDRIRVVSEANQNLVLNPNTGLATGVTDLFYGAGDVNEGVDPNVTSSAYTNSFAGATSTQLYGIDTGLDILVTQANSAGTLGTVGSLGVDLNDTATFDISGFTGTAYATVQDSNLSRSTFWTIDLATGDATMVGEIGAGSLITAMAVVPAPSSAGLLVGAGLLGASSRRRL